MDIRNINGGNIMRIFYLKSCTKLISMRGDYEATPLEPLTV